MHCSKAILILAIAASALGADFSGDRALAYTRRAVEFGPRPSGSPQIARLQAYIHAQLRTCRCEVRDDDFQGQTPAGPVAMKNIIARFPGTSGKAIVISGHYDTKRMAGFLGANDGGSSTGVLLELARAITAARRTDDVLLVWFDGEEAVGDWSASDSLYGSRHLAERWAVDGKLARIKALINVDMIGDRDLDILAEESSSPRLRELVRQAAAKLQSSRHFLEWGMAVEDDHLPFLQHGVAAIDLIDFNYGPSNSYWHTNADTIYKLSARSLEVVGRLVSSLIATIEGWK